MKIGVMMPMRDGMVHVECVRALNAAAAVCGQKGWEVEHFFVIGMTVIPMARASLVARALAWGADKLVFVDDDVSFTAEQFITLIEAPVRFVTGSYPMRPHSMHQRELVPTALFNHTVPQDFDENGLAPVDFAGFGFMRADREVFAALAPKRPLLRPKPEFSDVDALFYREWFPYGTAPAGSHPVAREPMFDWHSADVEFVKSAIAAGFPCYFHKDLKCGHHAGPIKYET